MNLKAAIAIGSIFLLSILYTYDYTDFSSNMSIGEGHVYTAKSLALSRNWDVTEYSGAAGVDVIKYNGKEYLPYAPLNAVLMSIPYFGLQVIYKIYTSYIGSINGDLSIVLESLAFSLPSSIALLVILFLLTKYIKNNTADKHQGRRLLLVMSTGLGTLLFTYSVSFFNHIIAAALIFSAFYIFVSGSNLTGRSRNFNVAVSGLLTGLGFLTEFPVVLFSIAIFIYQTYRLLKQNFPFKKYIMELIIYAIPISVCIALMVFYNYVHFGGFLSFGEVLFKEMRVSEGREVFGFHQNPLYGLYGMFFSPMKGLFIFSPFLLLSFPGLVKMYQGNRSHFILVASYIAILSLVYAFWNDCFGSATIGDRYMVTLIPFFAILSFYGVSAIPNNRTVNYVLAVLVIISVLNILFNSLIGIASGKSSLCEENLNSYTPYKRAVDSLQSGRESGFKMSPVLINYLK